MANRILTTRLKELLPIGVVYMQNKLECRGNLGLLIIVF